MSLNTNILGKFTRTTVPVPRRARQIKGNFTDRVRFFRCRKCGFICDINRDTLLGKETAKEGTVATPSFLYLVSDTGEYLTDETGRRITVSTGVVATQVIYGCPFCGSTRWKE